MDEKKTKPAVSFNVEFKRDRLGLDVPDWQNPATPYVEMLVAGRRYKRPAPVHHTPLLNGWTGAPHSGDRERQRRLRQGERRNASPGRT